MFFLSYRLKKENEWKHSHGPMVKVSIEKKHCRNNNSIQLNKGTIGMVMSGIDN